MNEKNKIQNSQVADNGSRIENSTNQVGEKKGKIKNSNNKVDISLKQVRTESALISFVVSVISAVLASYIYDTFIR